MQKPILKLISLIIAASLLAACSGQSSNTDANPYYQDNEIITRENLYDDRMVILIDTQYNVSAANIGEVVEAQFPEVNVVLRLHNTADSPYYTKKALELGTLGDIFFCAVSMTKDEDTLSKNFIDLSNAPFINNYYQNALDGVALNGKIYMLPGFSDIYGIVYDRTLFEEHNWELPTGRDEFIALCKTINEEMGYQAFMPTLKYGRMAMLISHAFHYSTVISGPENMQWLQSYRHGNESFSNHMEPLFKGMKELFDSGVLSEACFTIDPGIRSSMLYKEYTSAMTMESQNAVTYAQNTDSEHEYGMMPFWCSNDPDSDCLVVAPGFNILANKKLCEPENSEKLEKVMEILAYLSTPEGQKALMNEESTTISNVKGASSTYNGSFMEGVTKTIEKGNIYPEVRYTELHYNNPFQVAFRESLIGYVNGTMQLHEALAHCDEALNLLQTAPDPVEISYGTATRTFTTLETAEFVADILRKEANADIALVLSKSLSYGEAGNFYEGEITDAILKLVSLDYVSGKDPSYNRLVTVRLTGNQILSILNYPYLGSSADTRSMWIENDNPSYWVPSNLRIEYAPLLYENSVLSIKNMDGSEFDLEKTYTVAIWNGCFSNLTERDYFDEAALTAMETVTFVSDKTSTDLIKAQVLSSGEISPPDDDRFTIRWDVTPESIEK